MTNEGVAATELRRQRDLQRHRQAVRQLAVADVEAGMTLVGVAAVWGVDVATLVRWLGARRVNSAGDE